MTLRKNRYGLKKFEKASKGTASGLKAALAMVLLSGALLLSCSEDFEKFTDVTNLRVLAIQVDPAELTPGDTGNISALVAAPANEPVTYQWRWCPVPTTALTGHECPVTDEMLVQLIADGAGQTGFEVPNGSLFDLGNGESAAFPYVIDAGVLQLACNQVMARFGDQIPIVLDCDSRFATTIRLDVRAGDRTVTAVKELNLLLNPDAVPNANPLLGDVYGRTSESDVPPAELITRTFSGAETLHLRVAVNDASSEQFENISVETGATEVDFENLFMTWFITGGETEYGRTSYIAGETPFARLMENTWYLPSAEESGGQATLYVVLQDDRGGVSWIQRSVRLED
ncbi:MAG: hypothetical protein JXX14_08425 [Deltaproteobacteria bacterium]|nr:hypothetical protein [Deltaproteobacteria bacterium]